MSERLKKTPVWHKVFGVIETLLLAACATGERIGFVTPTPEGTKTNPTEIASTPSAGTIPTSAAETATATSVEFLGQDEVLATKLSETQTLTDLFAKFEADTQIKGLFTDPAGIEYSAMGIKAYMAESGKTVTYPFFSATSESEQKGYTAMILQPSPSEVVYAVLNRITDTEGKVGLGITQDLNHQLLEKPVMIFATGLTADQIAKMTDEELSQINLLFVPAGLPVSPAEAPLGVGIYLTSLKPVEPTPTETIVQQSYVEKLKSESVIETVEINYRGVPIKVNVLSHNSIKGNKYSHTEYVYPDRTINGYDQDIAQACLQGLAQALDKNSDDLVSILKQDSTTGIPVFATDLTKSGYNPEVMTFYPINQVNGQANEINIVFMNVLSKDFPGAPVRAITGGASLGRGIDKNGNLYIMYNNYPSAAIYTSVGLDGIDLVTTFMVAEGFESLSWKGGQTDTGHIRVMKQRIIYQLLINSDNPIFKTFHN